jgi:hypothetical protein
MIYSQCGRQLAGILLYATTVTVTCSARAVTRKDTTRDCAIKTARIRLWLPKRDNDQGQQNAGLLHQCKPLRRNCS